MDGTKKKNHKLREMNTSPNLPPIIPTEAGHWANTQTVRRSTHALWVPPTLSELPCEQAAIPSRPTLGLPARGPAELRQGPWAPQVAIHAGGGKDRHWGYCLLNSHVGWMDRKPDTHPTTLEKKMKWKILICKNYNDRRRRFPFFNGTIPHKRPASFMVLIDWPPTVPYMYRFRADTEISKVTPKKISS